jgi:hypothetical protein
MGKFMPPPPIILTIGSWRLVVEDLGRPMNTEFQTLYQELLAAGPPNWARHDQALFLYLDSHSSVPEHDSYFNNLTPYWQILQNANRYVDAVQLWHERIGAAIRWENSRAPRKVHKGTPLYFLGTTHIQAKSLERGFLAMHRALDEDARTRTSPTPNTPAYAFVTIDSTKADQYFLQWVTDLATYVESKLKAFSTSRGGTLTFADLRSRFLTNNTALREEAFFFSASCARVREYETGALRLEAESQFGSILELRTLFDMCIIVDRIIGTKVSGGTWKFVERVPFLFSRSGGRPNIRPELEDLNQRARNNPLGPLISDLLDLKYMFRGNRQPTRVEADLALSYVVRNHGAHVLESLPVVHDRFAELLAAILGSIFLAVQTLLP